MAPGADAMAPGEDTVQRRSESAAADSAVDRADPAERSADDRPVPPTHGGDNNLSADGRGAGDGPRGAALIGARAATLVTRLTGRRPNSVISIERTDGGWRVGVEVVEVSRIPDSADILAVYDVRLDADGDLMSYQRIRCYARGDQEREHGR